MTKKVVFTWERTNDPDGFHLYFSRNSDPLEYQGTVAGSERSFPFHNQPNDAIVNVGVQAFNLRDGDTVRVMSDMSVSQIDCSTEIVYNTSPGPIIDEVTAEAE